MSGRTTTGCSTPGRVMTDDKFARGMCIGLPVCLLLWGLIALAAVSLAGCQSYQPPAGGLEGGVMEVLR
jgi:hypothetical protein